MHVYVVEEVLSLQESYCSISHSSNGDTSFNHDPSFIDHEMRIPALIRTLCMVPAIQRS